jgi:hypothetical protein
VGAIPAHPKHPYRRHVGLLRLSSFFQLPGKRGHDGGSGEFSLGRGSKVRLSKVGPGVFLAIFGAGLIAYSFAKPMKVNIPAMGPGASNAASASKAGTTTVAAAIRGTWGMGESEQGVSEWTGCAS